MTKTTSEMNEAILKLKGKLAEQPKRKGGGLARVSVDLRSEAVALRARSGLTRVEMAGQLGINPTSMFNWDKVRIKSKRKTTKRRLMRKERKEAPVRKSVTVRKKTRFKQVVVRPDEVQSNIGGSTVVKVGLLAMELGGGARVTGLTLEDVAHLITLGAR